MSNLCTGNVSHVHTFEGTTLYTSSAQQKKPFLFSHGPSFFLFSRQQRQHNFGDFSALFFVLRFFFLYLFHGWAFFVAMKFSGTIVIAIDATTTNFFAHHTPTFKSGKSMFLKHFLPALQTKHVGASGADQNFPPQITTTVARGTVLWWSFHWHAGFVHVLARCQ